MSHPFPLYPYASDPLRILVPRGRASAAPKASPPPGDSPPAVEEPPPVPSCEAEGPPQDGEGDRPQGGGGGSPPNETPAGSRDHPLQKPDGPPLQVEENAAPEVSPAGRNAIMQAWLLDHWDTVEAMARAGEAPVRPTPPPEPVRAETAGADDYPPIHVARGDRWSRWKMAEFLRQLAASHSVSAAAKAVGMSRNSAYKLRARLKGQPFDIAWEAAFRHGYDDLAQAALELALEGEEVPHYYQGELRATHRKRNPQLMVQLLKMRNRVGAPMLGRYGAAAEFWSENWERMVHRIETGSVTWDDERAGLSEEERAALASPGDEETLNLIIARNVPDEPRGRFGR